MNTTLCGIELEHPVINASGTFDAIAALRTFGDAVIEVRPLPRGEGFAFEDKITGGVVPRQYIPSVEGLRNDHAHGGEYDPRRDLILAEVEAELVAAAETSVRTRDGIGVHHVEGWVRPAWRIPG